MIQTDHNAATPPPWLAAVDVAKIRKEALICFKTGIYAVISGRAAAGRAFIGALFYDGTEEGWIFSQVTFRPWETHLAREWWQAKREAIHELIRKYNGRKMEVGNS